MDKSTVIRRFIMEGLREYKRESAAKLYKERRVKDSNLTSNFFFSHFFIINENIPTKVSLLLNTLFDKNKSI